MTATRKETLADGVTLYQGDCLDMLKTLAANSVDACVTDPPYHLSEIKTTSQSFGSQLNGGRSSEQKKARAGFMGKSWDGGDIAFRPELWREVLRVLKPGGHLLAFGGTRTYHRMACAVEDAGFEIRDQIGWLYGQGFPKNQAALKPGWEPIALARKPLEGTLAGNVEKWGTGALDIDGCRVPTDETITATRNVALGSSAGGIYGKANKPGVYSNRRDGEASATRRYTDEGATNFAATPGPRDGDLRGRWPANVIHDGSEEVIAAFPADLKSGKAVSRSPATAAGYRPNALGAESRPSGVTTEWYGDEGSAARFYYIAKADADDRLGSKHPTVKPVDLMAYLVRLVTPKGGTVLDPLAGTGTTGEAALREGRRAVLIEREPEYCDDIRRRMRLAMAGPDERARESIKAKTKGKPLDHGPLFGGTSA